MAAIFGLGSTELFIILVIVLVLFGGGKLPQVGSALGKGIKNFRKAFGGQDDDPKPPEIDGSSESSSSKS